MEGGRRHQVDEIYLVPLPSATASQPSMIPSIEDLESGRPDSRLGIYSLPYIHVSEAYT